MLLRYFTREIAAASLLVLLALLALFGFFDLIRELDDLGKNGYRLTVMLAYVALLQPSHAYVLLPAAGLMGTLFALSRMSEQSEITVMRASGLSLARLAGYVAVAGLLIGAATVVMGELVAPWTEEAAKGLRLKATRSIVAREFRSGFWVKDDRSFVNIQDVTPDTELLNLRIYEFDAANRLLAVSRAGLIGPAIGLDPRYSTDLVAMAVVCIALAWLPTVDAPAPGSMPAAASAPTSASAAATDADADADGNDDTAAAATGALRRPATVRALGTVFVLAVLAAGLVSAQRNLDAWTPNPTKAYVLTLQQELRARPDVVLFDQHAPDQLLEPWFGEERRLSTLLKPTGLRPTLRSWQTELHVVDEAGRIRAAAVAGTPASSTAAPLCAPPGQPLRVRLDGAPLPLGTWTFQLNYLVNQPSSLTVAFGFGSTQVDVEQGIHQLFVQVDGNGDSVVLTPPPDDKGLCVTNLVVGRPTPV